MTKYQYLEIDTQDERPIFIKGDVYGEGRSITLQEALELMSELQAAVDQLAPMQTLYELRAAQDPFLDGKTLDEMVLSIFTAVVGMCRHYDISYDPQLAIPRLGMGMTAHLLNGVAENVDDIAKAAGTFDAPIPRFVNHSVISAEMFYPMIHALEKAINATPNYKAVVKEI